MNFRTPQEVCIAWFLGLCSPNNLELWSQGRRLLEVTAAQESSVLSPSPGSLVFLPQAFNKYKREGFCLQNVDKAPLAKRRKMKKTSTSTETRSSSSESSHSSSSHSHGKTTPTKTLQPSNPADGSNPETLFQFSD